MGFLFLACTLAPPARAPARPPACPPRPRPHQAMHTTARRPTYTNQLAHTNSHQARQTNKRCTPTNSHQPTRAKQCTPTNARQATWQGYTLEGSGGSGGSGARFWTPAVLHGRVVTFGLEGRETVAGADLAVAARAWKGRHFWSRGTRNRGKGVL